MCSGRLDDPKVTAVGSFNSRQNGAFSTSAAVQRATRRNGSFPLILTCVVRLELALDTRNRTAVSTKSKVVLLILGICLSIQPRWKSSVLFVQNLFPRSEGGAPSSAWDQQSCKLLVLLSISKIRNPKAVG